MTLGSNPTTFKLGSVHVISAVGNPCKTLRIAFFVSGEKCFAIREPNVLGKSSSLMKLCVGSSNFPAAITDIGFRPSNGTIINNATFDEK